MASWIFIIYFGVWSNTTSCYYSNCFVFDHWKLFQLAPVSLGHTSSVCVHVFMCVCVFSFFLFFWWDSVLQAHLIYVLPQPRNQLLLQGVCSLERGVHGQPFEVDLTIVNTNFEPQLSKWFPTPKRFHSSLSQDCIKKKKFHFYYILTLISKKMCGALLPLCYISIYMLCLILHLEQQSLKVLLSAFGRLSLLTSALGQLSVV